MGTGQGVPNPIHSVMYIPDIDVHICAETQQTTTYTSDLICKYLQEKMATKLQIHAIYLKNM